jgi:hypothetical protein
MRLIGLTLFAAWTVTFTARADGPATPLTVTSGFNVDAVAEGSGSAADSTSGGIDSLHSTFYDSSYDTSHGNLGGALPAGQTIIDSSGNSYSLAPATGNNALLIGNGNSSGTLSLSYAADASLTGLLVLGTSVDGGTILDYTLTFTGDVTASGTLNFADWHDYGNTGVFTGLGRINQSDNYAGSASLFAGSVNIPVEDQLLQLQSISFNYDAGNGNIDGLYPSAAIFGVSAFDPIIPVPEPASSALLICGAPFLALLVRHRLFKK